MSANPTTVSTYASRFGESATLPATDSEGTENFGAYGILRAAREKAEMLELRKRSGDIRAIGYGWVQKLDFDPSMGITLYAGDETIKIKGRNLNSALGPQISLLGGIIRHRVAWIAESDQSDILQAEKATSIVESIEW